MSSDNEGLEYEFSFDGVPISFRRSVEDDAPFIVDSWVMSYRNQARAKDAGRAYLRGHKRLVRSCLARIGATVACLESNPDVIVSWMCAESGVIHYLFTKQEWRDKGLAKALLATMPTREGLTYTHKSWRPVTLPGWSYDPYAFEGR